MPKVTLKISSFGGKGRNKRLGFNKTEVQKLKQALGIPAKTKTKVIRGKRVEYKERIDPIDNKINIRGQSFIPRESRRGTIEIPKNVIRGGRLRKGHQIRTLRATRLARGDFVIQSRYYPTPRRNAIISTRYINIDITYLTDSELEVLKRGIQKSILDEINKRVKNSLSEVYGRLYFALMDEHESVPLIYTLNETSASFIKSYPKEFLAILRAQIDEAFNIALSKINMDSQGLTINRVIYVRHTVTIDFFRTQKVSA